ncbi:MAG TPA: flagellar hook-basal body complex protein FliE [Cellvibrionaceae bacterium]
MTDRVDINSLLTQMRTLKSQTQAFQKPDGVVGLNPLQGTERVGKSSETPGFSELMAQAVNKVNDVQQASGATAEAYQRGEPGVDITDVMIASQKASVAFEATVQVRNKLVEAYRDIMNMPI